MMSRRSVRWPSVVTVLALAGIAVGSPDRAPVSRAPRTASGRPTPPTSAAPGIRRSIRSTPRTSSSSRSPGGSRPTTSARVPSSSWKARRSWSRACSTRPPARGARWSRSTARTGELIWAHSLREGTRAAIAPRQLSGRGVSYWTDGKGDERILYVTTGYRLVALNAKNGAMIPSFGKDGIVDLKVGMVTGTGQPIDLETGETACIRRRPSSRTSSSSARRSRKGMTDQDAQQHQGAGARLRRADRQAAVDVQHDSAARRVRQRHLAERLVEASNGNTGVWTQITVDEELGLVYLPVESPTSDFYGGHRPGNNLFGESLVCVDLKTGQRKWHFQIVHHPIWDYDLSSAPHPRRHHRERPRDQGGRACRARKRSSTCSIASPVSRCGRSKSGRCRRATCRASGTSPTQPFPTKPPAYARQAVTIDELIDFTPEMREQALRNFRAVQDRTDVHAAGR